MREEQNGRQKEKNKGTKRGKPPIKSKEVKRNKDDKSKKKNQKETSSFESESDGENYVLDLSELSKEC